MENLHWRCAETKQNGRAKLFFILAYLEYSLGNVMSFTHIILLLVMQSVYLFINHRPKSKPVSIHPHEESNHQQNDRRKSPDIWMHHTPILFLHYKHLDQKADRNQFVTSSKSLAPSSGLWLESEAAAVCEQMIRYWSTSHLCHLNSWTCDAALNW